MASNDIEVLDPAATVEKHKETESGVALDRRHFLTALGVAGAAASIMAGADLLSSGPAAFAQFQPPIGGYKQLDVMNFLMNIKYLKATLYSYITTGNDIPDYPALPHVTLGSGLIANPLKSAVSFSGTTNTQQIIDLFNEMCYDEIQQLVDLRNLIGNVTGDVLVINRPVIDLLGTKSTSTSTTTITYQQAIGYARMLEDLSAQAFAGATAYLTGANLAYVSQIMATDGYHAGALRLISIQQNIPYLSTGFLTTTAAGAQSLNTFSALLVPGQTSLYLTAPTNPPILGSAISGVNIPQNAVVTGYTPVSNATPTAIANNSTNPTVLTDVSSVSGLAAYQPISGTYIPAGTYIVPNGVGTNTVTLSAAVSNTTTVAPTGYTTSGSTTITGVNSVSGIVAGQPISGTGIPANATVVSASGTNIVITSPTGGASATSQSTFFGILTNGSASITSVSSTSGIAVGEPIASTTAGVPAGTTIVAIGNAITMSNVATATTTQTPKSITGTLTNNSATITSVSSTSGLVAGQPISGTGIAAGATITGASGSTITISSVASVGAIASSGTLIAGSNTITGVSNLTGIAVGQPISATGVGISVVTIPAGTLVGSINSSNSSITLSPPAAVTNPLPTGTVTSGSVSVTSVSSTTGMAVGQSITGNFIPAGTTIAAISGSTVTLSAPATGSSGTAESLIVVNAVTGTVTVGSTSLTAVSSTASLAVGQSISGNNIVPGTFISAISGTTVNTSNPATYTFTGSVIAGSNAVSLAVNTSGFAIGQTIAGLNIPSGTKITGLNPLTMSNPATGTFGPLLETLTVSGGTVTGTSVFIGSLTGGSNTVTSLSLTVGLAVGQLIVGNNLPVGTAIAGVDSTANTITLSNLVSGTNSSPTAEPLTIYSGTISAPGAIVGAVTGGSNTVTLSTTTGATTPEVAAAGLTVGQAIAGPNIPSGTIITSVNGIAGTLTMSNAATGTSGPLLESLTITGVSITVPLTHVAFAANAYYGPITGVTGGSTSAPGLPGLVTVGDNVVSTVPPLTGLAIGQPISGNYIPVGSTITVIGSGSATATNPGAGTVTISNAAVGSSAGTEYVVIGIPTSAILTIGLITPGVALTVTTTQPFTTPTTVTLKIPTTVTVTVGRSLMTISVPAGGASPNLQTLTMLTGDIMDVEPFDPGTAALAALGPAAITIPPSVYSNSGPTNPTVYQGFFNTASADISSTSPGTFTVNTPPGFMFARSFGETLSVLLGSTQFNPPTYQGGFFPVGVNGPINVNTDQ